MMMFAPPVALFIAAISLATYALRPRSADVSHTTTQRAAACICAAAALFVVACILLVIALLPN